MSHPEASAWKLPSDYIAANFDAISRLYSDQLFINTKFVRNFLI